MLAPETHADDSLGCIMQEKNILWYLTDGFWEDRGQTRRSFDVQPGGTLTVNITGLTPAGQQLARWALDSWSLVTGIQFREVTHTGADILFNDDIGNRWGDAWSDSDVSNGTITQSVVHISTDWLAHYGTEITSYSFTTYIHEIGHALGLGHPGPYNGSALFQQAKFQEDDHWIFTVMSYFDQNENPYIRPFSDKAYPVTPMLADAVAVQSLYGDHDVNLGDTIYGYGANTGTYMDEIFRAWDAEASSYFPARTEAAITIFDTGGEDWFDFRTDRYNQFINLGREDDIMTLSNVYGGRGNLAIFPVVGTIEHVIAGRGDDVVFGNSAGNIIVGVDGNDAVDGYGGNDWLVGMAGDDTLKGNTGHDVLWGGPGSDILNGGPGRDLFVFEPWDGVYLDFIEDFTGGQDKIDLSMFTSIDSVLDVPRLYNSAAEEFYLDLAEHGGGWIVLEGYHDPLSNADFIFDDGLLVA